MCLQKLFWKSQSGFWLYVLHMGASVSCSQLVSGKASWLRSGVWLGVFLCFLITLPYFFLHDLLYLSYGFMSHCNIRLSTRKLMGIDRSATQYQADKGKGRKEVKRQEHNIFSLLLQRAETGKDTKPWASYWLSCLRHKSCTCSILCSNPHCFHLSCAFPVSFHFTLSNTFFKQTENTQRGRNLT